MTPERPVPCGGFLYHLTLFKRQRLHVSTGQNTENKGTCWQVKISARALLLIENTYWRCINVIITTHFWPHNVLAGSAVICVRLWRSSSECFPCVNLAVKSALSGSHAPNLSSTQKHRPPGVGYPFRAVYWPLLNLAALYPLGRSPPCLPSTTRTLQHGPCSASVGSFSAAVWMCPPTLLNSLITRIWLILWPARHILILGLDSCWYL